MATAPPSTAKLFVNVQFIQLTTLCCSINITPPNMAVLFSNTVFDMVVMVSSVPANNTAPSSYQLMSANMESVIVSVAPV